MERAMMTRRPVTALFLLAAVPVLVAAPAPELAGEYSASPDVVFRFARDGNAYTGVVLDKSSGRQFRIADIRLEGDSISFFVVHDAAWDEEVKANGGRPFRNTARGRLTAQGIQISGDREDPGMTPRPYAITLHRLPATRTQP
jgi:hypothetical protein